MNYNILSSSSKGNAIIIEDILLLDCGVSYAKLKPYINKIKLIFISHSHKDHLNLTTASIIKYNKPNIKFVTGSKEIVVMLLNSGIDKKNIWYLKAEKWYNLGSLKIRLDELTHDVPNYALHFEYKNKKGIYIIDTANVDNIKAKGYDLYLIEANYKDEVLEKHIKANMSSNDRYYLDRVSKTHLSYSKANDFLIENMGDNSTYEYLHRSSYNFDNNKEEEEDGIIQEL